MTLPQLTPAVAPCQTDLMALFAIDFSESGEAKLISDSQNRILVVNKAFETLTGYTNEEVRGLNPGVLASGHTDRRIYEHMWECLREDGTWHGELTDRRKDGSVYPKFLSITVVRGATGAAEYYLGSFIDISPMKETRARLEKLAKFDTLTGLYNRHSFDTLLADKLQQASDTNQVVGVMYLDLDGFKKVNDSYGHSTGDELLQVVAQRIRSCVRESDIVARLGGDEFGIILEFPGQDPIEAESIAERLLEKASTPVEIDEHLFQLSVSIGITLFPDNGRTPSELTQRADIAMYEVKGAGKNGYCFFSQPLHEKASTRWEIETMLRQALAKEKGATLAVYYQPQYSLDGKDLTGMEALLRLWDSKGNAISPADFIPIAEEAGMINQLGAWVVEEVCSTLALWRLEGRVLVPVSVNVSPYQFKDKRLADHILSCADENNIPYNMLGLEITESVALNNPDEAVEALQTLKGLGVRISMDDFGTGYSCLASLATLPLSTLKIDKSFVLRSHCDENAACIAAATIALAHKLGLCVVAEGVETAEQVQFLKDQGCDYVQGFLYGKPQPAEDVARLMRA